MTVDLEELSCPISMQLMTDPVMADDGHTYQRDAIETWIKKCTTGKECEHHRGMDALTGTPCCCEIYRV
jgi:hypothetical protein